MRRIIISIPLVWGIRNYLLSGIAGKLEAFYEIYFAVPEVGVDYMINMGIPIERLIVLKNQKSTTLQRWCNLIIRNAHGKRFPTKSDQVFRPLRPVGTGQLRSLLLTVAGWIFSNSFLFGLLERAERMLFVRRIDPLLISRINAISPAFGLSTSFVVDLEWSLFRMLHHLGIPIYTHILSFDNLTSRGYLPIRYFDEFLVWNAKMAEELQHIYSVPSARISITGTPQFDFHSNNKFVRSLEWTREKLGIEARPYLVYCANHVALTPDEPQLFEMIAREFQGDSKLALRQVLLRLHPMDDYDRWNDVVSRLPFVRVSYPWPHRDQERLFWGDPNLEDLMLFSNTLRYCDLVLNIASSVSIDAAILDRPVICVGFSSNPANKYNSLYYNFHYSHHYEPIMATGATPLATGLKSLLDLTQEGINNPQGLSENRKEMVRLLCGNVDGYASERILDFFTNHKR